MQVVQVALEVPDDIYKGVMNGSLNLMGMVKDGHNRIRKHIPKASITKSDKAVNHGEKNGILEVVREHKSVVIALSLGAAAVGGATCLYKNWKNKKIEEAEEMICGFHKALKLYLKASKKGKLNEKVVDNLLNSLNELENKKIGKDIEISIPASQLTELIYSIFTYTESLARANEIDIQVVKPKNGAKGSIESLKSYLEIQKKILEQVA